MAQKNRVPKALSKFDTYIRRVAAFLLTVVNVTSNGERLGLTAGENTATDEYRKKWYTGNPADPGAYELHSNPNTKTKTTQDSSENHQ